MFSSVWIISHQVFMLVRLVGTIGLRNKLREHWIYHARLGWIGFMVDCNFRLSTISFPACLDANLEESHRSSGSFVRSIICHTIWYHSGRPMQWPCRLSGLQPCKLGILPILFQRIWCGKLLILMDEIGGLVKLYGVLAWLLFLPIWDSDLIWVLIASFDWCPRVVILGFSGRIIYLSLLEGLNWFLLFKLHVYLVLD